MPLSFNDSVSVALDNCIFLRPGTVSPVYEPLDNGQWMASVVSTSNNKRELIMSAMGASLENAVSELVSSTGKAVSEHIKNQGYGFVDNKLDYEGLSDDGETVLVASVPKETSEGQASKEEASKPRPTAVANRPAAPESNFTGIPSPPVFFEFLLRIFWKGVSSDTSQMLSAQSLRVKEAATSYVHHHPEAFRGVKPEDQRAARIQWGDKGCLFLNVSKCTLSGDGEAPVDVTNSTSFENLASSRLAKKWNALLVIEIEINTIPSDAIQRGRIL